MEEQAKTMYHGPGGGDGIDDWSGEQWHTEQDKMRKEPPLAVTDNKKKPGETNLVTEERLETMLEAGQLRC